MKARLLHGWDLSTAAARELQSNLAPRVSREASALNVRFVAGVDVCSPTRRQGDATAAVVTLRYPELCVAGVQTAQGTVEFPYVPGLLSFRELPLVLRAFEEMASAPDLVLVDGQGIAHPRRFGIAAHLGLLLDVPTIGCAKSWLIGDYEEPAMEAGSYTLLADDSETIGAVVRTRSGVRPVFVSIGHRVSLEQAVEWVLACCRGYRLPEPMRMAHQAAGGHLRRELTVAAA